jgi:hypothetical protein
MAPNRQVQVQPSVGTLTWIYLLQRFLDTRYDHPRLGGLTQQHPSNGSGEAGLTNRSARQDLWVRRARVVCAVAAISEHGYG